LFPTQFCLKSISKFWKISETKPRCEYTYEILIRINFTWHITERTNPSSFMSHSLTASASFKLNSNCSLTSPIWEYALKKCTSLPATTLLTDIGILSWNASVNFCLTSLISLWLLIRTFFISVGAVLRYTMK